MILTRLMSREGDEISIFLKKKIKTLGETKCNTTD